MTSSIAGALGVCLASALAEGLLAGSNVKGRFAALRLPRFSPPVWAWAVIGVLYYVLCFILVRHLLLRSGNSPLAFVALGAVVAMMAVNSAWNYVFFRARDLRASVAVLVGYDVLALAVGLLVALVDHAIALLLIPYLLYLAYATVWAYRLWKANVGEGGAVE